MAIVEFTKDCYPYCKGDTLQMDEQEMKDADALAKSRGVSKPYRLVTTGDVPAPIGTVDAVSGADERPEDRVNVQTDQAAAEANLGAPGVEAELAAEDERRLAAEKAAAEQAADKDKKKK